MIRYKLKIRKSKIDTCENKIPAHCEQGKRNKNMKRKINYIRKKVNTENKSPYTYKYGPLELASDFTMTKALLLLRDENGGVIKLQTKLMLACLVTSALKTSKYPRLLTTTRRLSEHFKVPSRLVQRLLNNLQDIKVCGVPLIQWRDYISDKGVPNLEPRERAIEILITGYDYIKYTGEDKDFFFDVDLYLYSDELDTTARVFLFRLQNLIATSIKKKMPPKSIMHMSTYADTFGFDVKWIRRIIRTLERKEFIYVEIERNKQSIYLTGKGWRNIKRFASVSSEECENSEA